MYNRIMLNLFISVVLPVFNEEKLLQRCLTSLSNQNYKGHYEIIVVDNGSTDNTVEIAARFSVKTVVCPKRGVVYARQAGADSASGEIIVQADADTVYPEDWLSRIAKMFIEFPDTVAVAGSYTYEDGHPWWVPLEYGLKYVSNKLNLLFLGNYPFISGANFAFRRDSFLKAGGYHDKSLYPDQWGIAHRLSKTGKLRFMPSLSVVTSPRRIQKPSHVIAVEILRNFYGILRHFVHYLWVKCDTAFSWYAKTRRTKIAVTMAVLILALLVYGYAAPTSQIFGKVYYEAKVTDKVVALTFDDGPNEPYTSEVLDILARYNIKATFFVVGKNVQLYPDVAKKIILDGNVIANHGYNHNANHALTTYGSKDVDLAQAAIEETLGVNPHLYRPPHGKKSPWELHALKHDDLVEVTWSVAANDQHIFATFGKPTPELYAAEIVKKVQPGKIILLHDGFGLEHGDVHADEDLTVETLPLIIDALQKQGYSFVTIPQLLETQAYN